MFFKNPKTSGLKSKSLVISIVMLLLVTMSLGLMVGCGQDELEKPPLKSEDGLPFAIYRDTDMACSIQMDQRLYSLSTFAKATFVDDAVQVNKTALTIYRTIEAQEIPLVTISVFDEKISKKELAKRNPQLVYVGTHNDRTYAVFYSEISDEKLSPEGLSAYNQIMNDWVVGMEDRISFLDLGN